MNRKQHKWAGFRAPKLRICTPDIIDHIVLHRRHSPPKTSSTDTIRSGRACQKPLLPASSPPKSDDQNSQKSFNNSQLGPGIPSMSTFCGQYSLEKNFLIVRSQVFRTFQISQIDRSNIQYLRAHAGERLSTTPPPVAGSLRGASL